MIFCAIFAFLVIFLTILGGFGVVVTGGVRKWTLGESGTFGGGVGSVFAKATTRQGVFGLTGS